MSEKDILKKLYDGVLGGIITTSAEAAQEALDAGITPLKAIDGGMTPAIFSFNGKCVTCPATILRPC